MEEVLGFSTSVGLPVTLAGIGLGQITPDMLQRIATRASAEGETIHNEPFHVTAEIVADAILAADAIGREWRRANDTT
jgi:glycerol dehydrogenase